MEYLQSNSLGDSEQYLLTKEAIEQGKYYYSQFDAVYRENMMVANFIREFDKLSGESIMGIYGAAHTGLEKMDITNTVPSMANQLKKSYGDMIFSEDLSNMAKEIDPYRVDTIKVGEKDYEASYFGKQNMEGFTKDFVYGEFWRLENAYDDLKKSQKTGYIIPYIDYPILIEEGQIFMIDYTKTDGSVIRRYYLSGALVWENKQCTEEFIVD